MKKFNRLCVSFIVCLFFVLSIRGYQIVTHGTENSSQKVMLGTKPLCIANRKTMCPNAQTKSYRVKGQYYVPQKHIEYKEKGVASYYGIRDKFHGKKTATGEIFNAYGLTAAHKTLPLPCYVKVTNLKNGKSLILKVNDRGPFFKAKRKVEDRIIDVSEKAAKELGFYYAGTTRVKVETLPEESLELQNNGTEIERS